MKKRYTNGGHRRVWALLILGGMLLAPATALRTLRAQGSAFVANQQRMAILPGNVKNVTMIDGELYCFTAGVMLKAQRSGEQLLGFWADTTYVRLQEGVEYVVRQPHTGDIYFTARNEDNRSFLYQCIDCDTKDAKVKQVRIGGGWFNKGITVEHPTFTADGKIMVFVSSDERYGSRGYDLWYTMHDGKRWGRPVNFGARVNTKNDEMSPAVYRDCLIFASNGHSADHGHLSLYSTRLVAVGDTTSDSLGTLQLGRCRVQRLPEPLNSDESDDFDMAIDTVKGCGYWVSKRAASDMDSQLYSFSGALDGVLLWGSVKDKYENPLEGVAVTALQGDTVVCMTHTDENGHYRVYLRCNQYYELRYQLDDFFVAYESINTTKGEEEYLISEAQQDVLMDQLPTGQRIYFEDIYGPDVDVQLSERGAEVLEPLVQFLNDNPSMKVDMTLINDLTTNRNFNTLLTDERIQSLENYLYPLLPPTVKISIENGCIGRDGCSNASGVSRLTVVINK